MRENRHELIEGAVRLAIEQKAKLIVRFQDRDQVKAFVDAVCTVSPSGKVLREKWYEWMSSCYNITDFCIRLKYSGDLFFGISRGEYKSYKRALNNGAYNGYSIISLEDMVAEYGALDDGLSFQPRPEDISDLL